MRLLLPGLFTDKSHFSRPDIATLSAVKPSWKGRTCEDLRFLLDAGDGTIRVPKGSLVALAAAIALGKF